MKFHKHDVHPAIESGHADRSDTPVTDRMEADIEAAGKRDAPVRLYQQLRAFERDRDELIEALQAILDGEYSNYIPSKLFDPARAILARIK